MVMRRLVPVLFAISLAACVSASAAANAVPPPAVDAALAPGRSMQTAVVAGGCFWGIQAIFEHVRGVVRAVSGYSGGSAATATYDTVGDGMTGHAESVEISYDASQITFGQLLQVFFSVGLDPTEVNRQGPDEGTQYRSVIFYATDEQQHIASAYISQLDAAGVYSAKIATQVVPLKAFYPAEPEHQDFFKRNPENLYIRMYDLPKVQNLEALFPNLYVR